MKNSNLVELGVAKVAHGIKGAASLMLYNPKESILRKDLVVTLRPLDKKSSLVESGAKFSIASIHFGNKTIVFFDGIQDRNELEEILPFKLLVEREDFPALSDGEFYLNDLIGLDAFNEAGKKVGVIHSTYDNGAQDILVIVTKSGDELEIPLVDEFFPEINIAEKKIIVRPPEII